jgi:hypothetical protein
MQPPAPPPPAHPLPTHHASICARSTTTQHSLLSTRLCAASRQPLPSSSQSGSPCSSAPNAACGGSSMWVSVSARDGQASSEPADTDLLLLLLARAGIPLSPAGAPGAAAAAAIAADAARLLLAADTSEGGVPNAALVAARMGVSGAGSEPDAPHELPRLWAAPAASRLLKELKQLDHMCMKPGEQPSARQAPRSQPAACESAPARGTAATAHTEAGRACTTAHTRRRRARAHPCVHRRRQPPGRRPGWAATPAPASARPAPPAALRARCRRHTAPAGARRTHQQRQQHRPLDRERVRGAPQPQQQRRRHRRACTWQAAALTPRRGAPRGR